MQCLLRRARIAPLPIPSVRAFNTTPLLLKTAMPTRPKPPPDSEIEESYLKGSGPGGQKIVRTLPCKPSSHPHDLLFLITVLPRNTILPLHISLIHISKVVEG